MKGQPHLVLSIAPLKQGSDIEALCGKIVLSAKFVFEDMVSGDIKTLGQMTVRVCQKCSKAFFDMDRKEFASYEYLYGMLPSVEIKAQDWEAAS